MYKPLVGSIVAAAVLAAGASAAGVTTLHTANSTISGQGQKTFKENADVNSHGRVVYMLTGDSQSHPLCTSGCLSFWPPVTASAAHPTATSQVKGKLAIWHHGSYKQVTLNGHPLYTYSGDSKAGVATGQGIKLGSSVWKAVPASGVKAASTGTSTSTSTGAYGY